MEPRHTPQHTASPGDKSAAGRFAIRCFDEASDQEGSLPGFHQHYSQLTPGRFEGSVSSLALPGFQILRERMNVAVMQAFTAPADRIVSFCVPSTAGGFRAEGAERSTGSFGVGRGWSRFGISGEHSDVILVLADMDVVEADARPRAGDVRTDPSATQADALFDWLASLLAVHASGEAARSPGLDDLVCDLLRDRLSALLSALSCPLEDQPAADRTAHALHRTLRDWLEAHPREPATVAGLSRALGVRLSELRGMSLAVLGHPLDGLLLARRLGQARRDIIAARGCRRLVSDIALDWGFAHWGRFSGTYRAFFGETPSRTLRGA